MSKLNLVYFTFQFDGMDVADSFAPGPLGGGGGLGEERQQENGAGQVKHNYFCFLVDFENRNCTYFLHVRFSCKLRTVEIMKNFQNSSSFWTHF